MSLFQKSIYLETDYKFFSKKYIEGYFQLFKLHSFVTKLFGNGNQIEFLESFYLYLQVQEQCIWDFPITYILLHICISMTSSESRLSSVVAGLVFRLKLKIRTQLKKSMITSGEPLMLVALIGCDPSIANVFYSRFVILKWKSRFVQANASVCLAKVDYSLPLSLL